MMTRVPSRSQPPMCLQAEGHWENTPLVHFTPRDWLQPRPTMTPKVIDSIAGDNTFSQHTLFNGTSTSHAIAQLPFPTLLYWPSLAWHTVESAPTYRALLHLRLTRSGNDPSRLMMMSVWSSAEGACPAEEEMAMTLVGRCLHTIGPIRFLLFFPFDSRCCRCMHVCASTFSLFSFSS